MLEVVRPDSSLAVEATQDDRVLLHDVIDRRFAFARVERAFMHLDTSHALPELEDVLEEKEPDLVRLKSQMKTFAEPHALEARAFCWLRLVYTTALIAEVWTRRPRLLVDLADLHVRATRGTRSALSL